MESIKVQGIFKLIATLAVISVVCNIIAFTSNGWSILKDGNTTVRVGLWYRTRCFGNGKCKTVSIRDAFSDSLTNYGRIVYSRVVRWQVVTTISLACSIVCIVMICFAFCRPTNYRKIGLVIAVCSFLSGFLLLYELGIHIRGLHISIQQAEKEADDTIYFPWSLVMVFFSTCSILSVSCAVCVMERKIYQRSNQRLQQNSSDGTVQFQQSRNVTVGGILIAIFSIVFRVIAYASNSWRILKNYTTPTVYFGLWYVTECRNNDDCKTISMRSYIEKYFHDATSYEYRLQVGSQIVLTHSLMLSVVCLLLLFLESRLRHSNNLMRLSIILSSLLSGTFWLYDVGHYIRIFAIDMEDPAFTAYFPWSILFAFLGTILILILSFWRFVKEFQIKEIDYAENTNNPEINMS